VPSGDRRPLDYYWGEGIKEVENKKAKKFSLRKEEKQLKSRA